MNLKPIGDRVIVEIIEEDEMTAGGIVLAGTARDSSPVYRATVLAVGDGRVDHGQRIPVGVEVGNEVYISRYGGLEIKVDGDEYLIVRETDLLAVVA